jgi:hypothetical protein
MAALIACLFRAAPARAVGEESASPNVKGVTGGALLGAEIVMLTEAALGAKDAWLYLAGGGAGAVAGGVGGYFAEQSGSARLSLFLLAGGMALVIPTTVAVLSATAYEPPADYIQDRGPVDEPVADPAGPSGFQPEPGTELPPPPSGRSAPAGDGAASGHARGRQASTGHTQFEPGGRRYRGMPPRALVGVSPGALTLSLPPIEMHDVFSTEQVIRYGIAQRTELRLPVLHVVF